MGDKTGLASLGNCKVWLGRGWRVIHGGISEYGNCVTCGRHLFRVVVDMWDVRMVPVVSQDIWEMGLDRE